MHGCSASSEPAVEMVIARERTDLIDCRREIMSIDKGNYHLTSVNGVEVVTDSRRQWFISILLEVQDSSQLMFELA